MNTLKHTPGPWRITDGPSYGYNRCTRIESDHGKFGTVICERFTAGIDAEVVDEYMDNLRLIAAAPELLAALEALTPWVDVHSKDRTKGSVLDENIEKARAAIAKATGTNEMPS